LKNPVRHPIIFTLLIGLSCLILPVKIFAEQPYPGPVLLTASSWEGEASPNGFGAQGGLSFEGYPAAHVEETLNVAYRWANADGAITPMPGFDFLAGYRFPIKGLVSLTPLAGPGMDFAVSNSSVTPILNLTVGVRLSLLLLGRDYLTLTPGCALPVANMSSGSIPSPRIFLAVGIRKEKAWMIPVRETRPLVTANPVLFSPDGDGLDDTVDLSIKVNAPESVKNWKLSIMSPGSADSGGSTGISSEISWREFSGIGKPPASVAWDGKSDAGIESEPGVDYRVIFETTDALGRMAKSETAVTVDILVIRDGDRYKVKVPDIRFPSYSYELSPKESQSLLDNNRAVLKRIATLFTRFPDYHLTIEGYANAEFWNDPKKKDSEERDTLIPLSAKRAETVRQALVLLGIDASRIRTTGMGSARQVADFSDTANNWKNRRVEFILSK